MSREPHAGIERKILTSILWVGILPMTVALIVGYITARTGQSNAVQQTLLTAAQKTAVGIQMVGAHRSGITEQLASAPSIIRLLEDPEANTAPEREAILRRLARQSAPPEDGLSDASLYDAAGDLIVTTDPDSAGARLDLAQATGLAQSSIISLGYSPTGDRIKALALARIRAPETGALLGYLAIGSGVDSLVRFALGETQIADETNRDVYQVVIVDAAGVRALFYINADSNLVWELLPTEGPASPLDAVLTPDPETGLRPASGSLPLSNYAAQGLLPGTDVLLAYQKIVPAILENQDIYLVVSRSASEVFSNITFGALLALVGCILFIAVLCVNAYRDVHNNIVRPISLLNEGAQIIRQGDFDLKLKIGTGDEIEELASSFNKMALTLSANVRKLEESEEKYRNVVTSMRDGIIQTNHGGIITFINPTGIEILGFLSEEDAVGSNMSPLFIEEEDFAHFLEGMDLTESGKRPRVWMRRKDDVTICVELSCSRLYGDDRTVTGIEGTVRDVTTSFRLEEEARERSERISAINQIANVINSSLEAGRLYESLVAELKKILDFDYASVALLRSHDGAFDGRQLWPDQEVQPGYTFTLDSQDSYAAWVSRERACLLVDDLGAGDSPFANQFPSTVTSCLCVPLHAVGRIIGTLNLGSQAVAAFSKHDVDVLEQMSPHLAVAIRNAQLLVNLQLSLEEVTRGRERLHKANEELKTLDEMKTNLLSNVSHELRTPLVAVMGYNDMIFSGKAGPINNVQQEYLQISLRNIEKLVTLIENLLDFSRLHRGDERIVFNVFDLVDCARMSIQVVQPVVESRAIAVDLIVPDGPILVEGDKEKMGQVFNNLLSNAVKFNHNGGRVTVEMKLGETWVEVSVSDTGIGIPSEAIEKVFTRFYQYDATSTRKYGGTGIGLSIAQDIARLHGSSISASSEEEKGSTFRFRLGLTRDRKPLGAPVHAELPAPEETHLLIEVVSLDRALSAQVRSILEGEGMDTIHTSSPEQAIVLAQKHRPDCLLLDLNRSEDATADLDTLIQNKITGQLPIILLTSDDEFYERYRPFIAARVPRSFRKSTLLGGIHHGLSQQMTLAEPLGDKVLCVDDDPEVLTFMRRCLESEGFAVDACESGEEALNRVASRDYGLVLLDIAMPGMDGWETCRKIRVTPDLAHIKIYMVTAKPIEEPASKVHAAGADGFLLKPFRPQDLVQLARGLEIPTVAKHI